VTVVENKNDEKEKAAENQNVDTNREN